MTGAGTSVRDAGLGEAVARVRDGALVVDVREPAEWAAGHVAGAVLLPLAEVRRRIAEVAPDREAPIVLHCAVGGRSARAAAWLAELGYRDVVNLRAPIDGWAAAGGAWESPAPELPPDHGRRYARQLLVPELGPAGQQALLKARAARGRRWARVASRALPGRRGRRDHRPRGR